MCEFWPKRISFGWVLKERSVMCAVTSTEAYTGNNTYILLHSIQGGKLQEQFDFILAYYFKVLVKHVLAILILVWASFSFTKGLTAGFWERTAPGQKSCIKWYAIILWYNHVNTNYFLCSMQGQFRTLVPLVAAQGGSKK